MNPISRFSVAWNRISALRAMTIAVAVLVGLTLTAQGVSAQSATMPRAEAVKRLAETYGEAPVALGIASFGLVVEVFATADGATWTIIATTPDRMSRVIAAGRDWTPMLPTTAAAFKKVRAVAPMAEGIGR
ncbi:MAG: hypothetical protein V3R75_03545 [Alphaproteobacteria bacterium]